MKGTAIQQMFQQVVTLVFIVCKLWRPIPGGATAKEQLASNPRNGPFRPTSSEAWVLGAGSLLEAKLLTGRQVVRPVAWFFDLGFGLARTLGRRRVACPA